MDINVTLLGEMITFAVLIWVTMKFIWPPIVKAMQERQEKIAAGLEAAERGQHNLELSQKNAADQIRATKVEASRMLDQANERVNVLIEEAKVTAQKEGEKLIAKARNEIEQEVVKTKRQLQQQTSELVIKVAEKVLQQKIDKTAHEKLIDQLIEQI
jgi:F-type H+-transporting ATPase subunit b